MKKKAIIFDLDGTLLNTDLLIKNSFIHTFEKYKPGYTLSEKELLSFLGPSLYDTFSCYFPQSMVQELIAYYRQYNLKHHEDFVTIYPGVQDTLAYLQKQGYPMAVVTTKMKDVALLGLKMFALTDHFETVIGHDDVQRSKPDPEGILMALDRLQCQDGYYIGDNITDILAGKNAKLKTIGVKWSPKGYELMAKENPDLLIDHFSEIIDFIKEDEKC